MKKHGFVRSSDPSGLSVKQKLTWGSALPFASGPKSARKVSFTPRASNGLRFKSCFMVVAVAVAAGRSAPRPGA